MIRAKRAWQCPECQKRSHSAHIQALEDYFLLKKSTITNQECCEFLQLNSSKVALRLFRELKIPRIDKNKYTYYKLTYPLEQRFKKL